MAQTIMADEDNVMEQLPELCGPMASCIHKTQDQVPLLGLPLVPADHAGKDHDLYQQTP